MTTLCAAVALTLHLWSWHSEPGYVNANWGAGLDCEVAQGVTVAAGAYRNSYGRPSPYAMVAFERGREFRLGVLAGIAGNYPDGAIAIGGFTAGVDLGPAVVRVLFAPPAMKKVGMAHLMISFPMEVAQ